MTDHPDSIIEAMIMYKARGWRAISPRPTTPAGRAGPAVVLIGSNDDGFKKVLAVRGVGRFDKAAELAARYNAAPEVSLSQEVATEGAGSYGAPQIKNGSGV